MADAKIIDGKVYAEAVTARVTAEVAALIRDHGLKPGLAVVLVGDDPASQIYVRSKGERSLAAGMHSVTHRLPAETIQDRAARAGARRSTPTRRSTASWCSCRCRSTSTRAGCWRVLDPDKDVDGLTLVSAGRLASGLPGLRALHAAAAA